MVFRIRATFRSRVALFVPTLLTAHAVAQCDGSWERFPSAQERGILAIVADEAGEALYGGGTFMQAAGAPCAYIGRFDGREWSPLGSGMNGPVNTLLRFDPDGPGPMPRSLLAGGAFTTAGGVGAAHIARWDGSNWFPLGAGMDGPVLAMTRFDDDGPGPHAEALVAAGLFTSADGSSANSIAKWDGFAWSALSTGVDGTIRALAVFDPDGSGAGLPRLYAAGTFMNAGGVAASGIASWDGSTWSALGNGTLGFSGLGVYALCAFDEDGTGPLHASLFAGGHFSDVAGIPAQHLARWDGSAWSSLPQSPAFSSYMAGATPAVRSLIVCDEDGPGPLGDALLVGGAFQVTLPSGAYAYYLARWDGTAWGAPGQGPSLLWTGALEGNYVSSMTTWDEDGTGSQAPRLWAVGRFQVDSYETTFAQVARWDAASWTWPVIGTSGEIKALAVVDLDGPEPPALYAAGPFTLAGGQRRLRIAKWDGTAWTALGDGIQPVGPYGGARGLSSYDPDGSGPLPRELVVAGFFTGAGGVPTTMIAKWNGSAWSALAGGLSGVLRPVGMATFDSDGAGPLLEELYVGALPVGLSSPGIGRWDGASWHEVGAGVDGEVRAMTLFDDDGSGPHPSALIVAGSFQNAGGSGAANVARWDGLAWSALGAGVGSYVSALAVLDEDGPGPASPALFAGGSFVTAGGNPALGIARWNGVSWSAVGAGAANVKTLAVHDDDGDGPHREALYAGGDFTVAGGTPALRLAKWDGSAWSALSGGIGSTASNESVLTLASFDADGPGPGLPALCIGGEFQRADGLPSSNLAMWLGCASSSTPYCSGDGSAAACPCANSGAPGNGCAHSLSPIGANLSTDGFASVATDSLVLLGSIMPESTCIYVQGTAQVHGGMGVTFGDGLRCVAGSISRLGIKSNSQGASRYPEAGDPPVSVRGACSGGDVRNYQVWYRNAASFCTPLTFNLTNGIVVTWAP